jgi:hypothetical protein
MRSAPKEFLEILEIAADVAARTGLVSAHPEGYEEAVDRNNDGVRQYPYFYRSRTS